ncbi:hypothetical protein BCR33DRAFT_791192 [Rhizoclosmatium globosum]|uniref:Uncharacterized protein n=1 Tax=Rhizoclosmatium globosum TaxID=329046 RepID=A0A1Y2BH48_9FUNG|nr:hypothetical protein BCR33DRAFT_791192 [Rhizoclosmatium globosum]|eukprot:ORY34129.1 hypothetical protein BCR33DRAFT_791192 [Rhizoclosmatium globosum]
MNSHRLYFLFHVAAAALLFLIVVVLKGRIQAQTFDSPPIRFPSTAQEGHLDTSPRPNSFDVVISYYKEDILYLYECVETFKKHPRIAAVNPDFRLILYVKSNVTEKSLSFIQDITEADEVIQLENVGREGHTYLHHIITHYDNLADHTLFMQGCVLQLSVSHSYQIDIPTAEPVDWIDGPTNSTRLHPDPSDGCHSFTFFLVDGLMMKAATSLTFETFSYLLADTFQLHRRQWLAGRASLLSVGNEFDGQRKGFMSI